VSDEMRMDDRKPLSRGELLDPRLHGGGWGGIYRLAARLAEMPLGSLVRSGRSVWRHQRAGGDGWEGVTGWLLVGEPEDNGSGWLAHADMAEDAMADQFVVIAAGADEPMLCGRPLWASLVPAGCAP